MSDEQAKPMGRNPNYIPPDFVPTTERELMAKSRGFTEGYDDGVKDVLYSLAAGHEWAIKRFDQVKSTMKP